MTSLAVGLVLAPAALFGYAYLLYPALLWVATRARARAADPAPWAWPSVTLTIPVYNEEHCIAAKLDDVLRLDYPRELLQVLVISDASTDRTDDLVAGYADRGVELLRLPARRGKSAAENAAFAAARGSIIVNSDAAVRLPPDALRRLVRAFGDPTVGVASGRDVSVGHAAAAEAHGESGYVGYEMWVRQLETRAGTIVGASGCFYGIRARIYDATFPEALSRDFASALIARSHGLRAVSVDDAICWVPRSGTLQAELRRKSRTMARGLETLWHWRRMMNPLRYGTFAVMLISHKLCRWLVYLALPLAIVGLVMLAPSPAARVGVVAAAIGGALAGSIALRRASGPAASASASASAGASGSASRWGRVIALPAFALAAVLAGVMAWLTVFRRQHQAVWEPTRRPA